MADTHFEPYLVLSGLSCESALISWGGFWFRLGSHAGDEWQIVDDEALHSVSEGRTESIGARSEPFGAARVEVLDTDGNVVASSETREANHVWVRGLRPNTRYRYRVFVDEQPWAHGARMDWVDGRLEKSHRVYECSFVTHPSPEQDVPLRFAVFGDYGVGIRGRSELALRQRRLAHALERAAELCELRLILTTGDNIYHIDEKHPTQGSGDEDDDWFFTFYQPYRYLLSRIPIYPSVGNHDTGDTELSDDRAQLADNFFLEERFPAEAECSLQPGLFYRLRFGKNVELVCVDTSGASELPESHYFEHREHAEFLARCFPERSDDGPRWRIPFGHHPPYCAGPQHTSSAPLIERLVPLLRRAGVRVMFAGHEHNFQLARADGIHYFVTGAGGKLRPEWPKPARFADAHVVAWSPHGHFLLVSIDGPKLEVRAICGVQNGALEPLSVIDPEGRPLASSYVIVAD